MKNELIRKLEETAIHCRKKVVRMIEASGRGHLGGALSCIDILTALYFHTMNIDPKNPGLETRDRFVLSAGHKCMALYAVLAQKGFFDEKILDTYGELHSKIPGHPDMHKLPGIEANTGALGHGLSIGIGMALAMRLKDQASKVYVVMGDGELAEGSNWEAVAAATHHKLDNLVVFVDDNGLQISGKTTDVMSMEPIDKHFRGFGWSVTNIDGNNMQQLIETLDTLPLEKGKPSLVVAHTVKGKGISFAENNFKYHYWRPDEKELKQAKNEFEAALREARN